MLSHSDIPEDYDPGRFFLYALGIYIVMENFVCVNFSGHHMHGGQPPTAPRGEAPLSWAYRFVVISYPPEKMTNGSSQMVLGTIPLGVLPKERTFQLSKEMNKLW